MNYWILESDLNRYQTIKSVDEVYDTLEFDERCRNPEPFSDSWQPVRIEIAPDDGSELPASDFPHATFGYCMSSRAAEVLRPLIGEHGEFLPLIYDRGNYTFFHATTVLDCIDYEKSTVEYFPHDPSRIMNITKYIFHEDKIGDTPVFMIPELNRHVFVSEAFRDGVHRNELLGFRFEDPTDWFFSSLRSLRS